MPLKQAPIVQWLLKLSKTNVLTIVNGRYGGPNLPLI